MHINQILAALVAVGGLGFINYSVADKLGTVEFNTRESNMRLPYMLSWSIPDFAIYLAVNMAVAKCLTGNWLIITSLILTIIIVFFFSLKIQPLLSKFSNWLINRTRNSNDKGSLFVGSPWNELFSSKAAQMVFIFDFDKKPIVSGYLSLLALDYQHEPTASIMPFTDSNGDVSFEDLIESVSTREIQEKNAVRQYVDFDRKIIVVSVIKKDKPTISNLS